MTLASIETTNRKGFCNEGFTTEKRRKSDSSNIKEDKIDLKRLRYLLSVVGPLADDINLAQIAVDRCRE